jgi:hypothetical protein
MIITPVQQPLEIVLEPIQREENRAEEAEREEDTVQQHRLEEPEIGNNFDETA